MQSSTWMYNKEKRACQSLLEGLGSAGGSAREDRALQVEVRRGPEGTVKGVARVGNDTGVKIQGQKPRGHWRTGAVCCHLHGERLSCSKQGTS